MGRLIALTAVVLAVATASGCTPDSVTGFASTGAGRDHVDFTLDARSGPSGENPTGTVWFDAFLGDLGRLPVTCLNVSGNRAGIVLDFPVSGPSIPAGAVLAVEDNPGGQDALNWTFVDVLPTTCPAPAGPLPPIVSGDIVVTDGRRTRAPASAS